MKLKVLFPAVAFLSLLMLFGLAGSTFLSLSPVSPAYAQNGAPVFPEVDEDEEDVDYTRAVDENTKPYAPNENPDAPPDYVTIGDPITATGTGIIYSIENARTAHFGIDSYTGHLLVGSPLDHEKQSSYTVTAIATNTSGTARQEVTINVNDVEESGKVALSWTLVGTDLKFAANLSDPDGGETGDTYEWYESDSYNGNWGEPISGATSATHTITPDEDPKHLRVIATYTDERGAGKTATATLRRPIQTHSKTLKFEAAATQGYNCDQTGTITRFCVFVARNQTPDSTIYYPAHLSYSDNSYPGPGGVSYSLAGRDSTKFSVDPSSRELIATETNGYNSPGAGGYYEVKITATDLAGKAATITIEARPSGSSNNPRVEGPRVIHYPENGTWQLATYTGTFDNPEQTVGWIIAVNPGGGDGDFFDIDDDGVLSFTQPPDYEQGRKEFRFSVHAYASNGPRGATYYPVRVIVEDVNDPPEIDGPTEVDFPENSTDDVASYTVEGVDPGESATWDLSGDDASGFSLASTGDDPAKLRFNSPPNYESFDTAADEHIFLLTLMVDVDGDMKTEHVRVEVTDVNEPPWFASETTTRNVGENAGPNEDIGDPVTATDPDKDDYLTYDLTGTDDDASFEIVEWSGQLQTITGVDYGSKNNYTVTVTATDQGSLTDTITVTITTQEENDPPVFDDANLVTTLSVAENSLAGTTIGAPITATDEDNTSLTYTLEGTGTDKDSFTIDNNGQIKTKTGVTYDYENPGDDNTDKKYLVTVKASDGTASATIDVTIDVTNVDEDGTVTFDSAQPKAGTLLTATLTDPDGNVSGDTWEWLSANSATGTFTPISGETVDTYTPTVDDVGKYLRTKASYTDDEGSGKTAEATTTVGVTPANTPPTFTGGNNPTPITLSVPENSLAATVVGTVSTTDPESDTLTYSLEGTPEQKDAFNDAFSLDSSTGEITVKANNSLDHETTDTYTFNISVSDGKDAAGGPDTTTIDSTVAVTINVNDVNEPPSFLAEPTTRNVDENAGANEDIGDPVEATDPDKSDSLNYDLTGTDDDASFYIVLDSGQLQTNSGVDYGSKNSYTVTVTVRDSGGLTDTITVTITTNEENDAPVFDDGSLDTVLEIAENTAGGVNIGDPITADDEDNPSLTYTLEGTGTDKDSFTIDNNGQIKTKAGVTYNYEAKDTYSFTVKASDGTAAGTIDVTINVTDVNETPTFNDGLTATRSIPENTHPEDIGAPVAATDPDNEKTPNTQTLTYTLGGTDAASFDIDTSSGQLRTKDALDHDTKATYTVAVSVRDSKDDSGNDDMADDDTIAVTITVTGENEPPEFDANLDDTREVAENTPANQNIGDPFTATDPDNGDTPTYTLEGTDAGSFEIVSTDGQIKTKAGVIYDYEAAKNSYEVTVKADDSNGGTDTIDVTINLTNVDEAGSVTFDTTPPKAGTPLVATVTDPDKNPTVTAWEWLKSTTLSGTFTTITGETTDTYTPTVDDLNHYLKAEASYEDDQGPGKTAEGTTTAAVTAANTPPTFTDDDNDGTPNPLTFDVAENSAANFVVGTISAAESDTGDTLTYSLEGETAEVTAFNEDFNLDPSTGEITVKANNSLDHETTDTYTFNISVSDGKDAAGGPDTTTIDSTVAVTINVNDVNEPPSFPAEPTTRNVDENAGANEDIGDPVEATDPDKSDSLNYDLTGTDDDASFYIALDSGQLQTNSGVDYGSKNSYTVTVTVRDSGGLTDTITVTITTNEENDAPVFDDGSLDTVLEIAENTAGGVNIGDPITADDEDNPSLTYTLEGTGTDKDSFTIDNNGQIKTKAGVTYNYEAKDTYSFTVKASDGTAADTIDVTINVTDVNEPPTFDGRATTRTVAENTAASTDIGDPILATDEDRDTLTYTLGGADVGSFDIDSSSGQLKTRTGVTYDHETKPSYSVTVSVSDSKNMAGDPDLAVDATIDVTINVTNVNESPFVAETPNTNYAENGSGPVAEYTAEDPDSEIINWVLSGDDGGDFSITPTGKTGVLNFITPPDYEAPANIGGDNVYVLTVKASDGDNEHTLSVTITVTNVDEAGTVTLNSFFPQVGTRLRPPWMTPTASRPPSPGHGKVRQGGIPGLLSAGLMRTPTPR